MSELPLTLVLLINFILITINLKEDNDQTTLSFFGEFTSCLEYYQPHQMNVLVSQSCPTLCNPMDLSMEFSRQEYWSGLPFPSPRDLPNPGIELGSPALQADSLPTEPPGKPSVQFSRSVESDS